jgi:hypothetical protein
MIKSVRLTEFEWNTITAMITTVLKMELLESNEMIKRCSIILDKIKEQLKR